MADFLRSFKSSAFGVDSAGTSLVNVLFPARNLAPRDE